MVKKRIGILRGGEVNYESSLKHGGEIITHIAENLADKFKVFDILVDKDGAWHLNGLPIKPSDLIHKVDVVWNLSQPNFSLILEKFNVPVIGASVFSSAIINNRAHLEKHTKELGIKMPRHIISPKNSQEVFEKFASPWIVRSDSDISVVKTLPELENTIADAIKNRKDILVEELIAGKIVSVHSVRGFRGQDIYTFPVSGSSVERFSDIEKEKLAGIAKNLHDYLGAHPYLKSNFVVHPKRGIFLTGILFTPNLKNDSHFSQVCEMVGAKTHHVVEHIIEKASS